MKIFCQQCGNELKEGVVICSKCGFENKIAKGHKGRLILLVITLLLLIAGVSFVLLYKYEKIRLPVGINKTLSKYLGIKEYNGKDLVVDSLHQRSDGAKNWEAEISDSRDGKTYRIVKMPDDRWWMAQNLNYQKGLVQNERSDYANGKEFTTTENGVPAIGSYWCNDSETNNLWLENLNCVLNRGNKPMIFFKCPSDSPDYIEKMRSQYPGGEKGSGDTVERSNTCNTYGALYTWETAMLPDGVGAWSDITIKNRSTSNDICPSGWRVPTDNEWATMLNNAEVVSGGNKNHDSIQYDWAGSYAGWLLKAKSACLDCSPSPTEPIWRVNEDKEAGVDYYGFTVIPAGNRGDNSFRYVGKGSYAYLWSSTVDSEKNALFRKFDSYDNKVFRGFYSRMNGFSVRCIQNLSK